MFLELQCVILTQRLLKISLGKETIYIYLQKIYNLFVRNLNSLETFSPVSN